MKHELSFTNFNSENFVILIQYLDLVTCYFVLTSFQILLFHVFHVKNLISYFNYYLQIIEYISILSSHNCLMYIFMSVINTHSARIFEYLMHKEIYSSSNKIAKLLHVFKIKMNLDTAPPLRFFFCRNH